MPDYIALNDIAIDFDYIFFVDLCGFSMTASPKNKCPKCRENSPVSCALTCGSTGSSRGATRLRLLRGDLVGAWSEEIGDVL